MGERYLIDTNSLIDAQMSRLPKSGLKFLKQIIDEEFNVSFITYIEFLGFKNISKSSEEFLGLATVLNVNKEIIDICIRLRKSFKIKLPDAVIAATAIHFNLTLVTNNERDFTIISDLNVLNPHKIPADK